MALTATIALTGCAVGAVGGWFLGSTTRGRPVVSLLALLGCLAVGATLGWFAREAGLGLLSAGCFGAAFGSMTAVKYAAGLIPGMIPPVEERR